MVPSMQCVSGEYLKSVQSAVFVFFISQNNQFQENCTYGFAKLFDLLKGDNSPWDWEHNGIKLGAEHVIYQRLANFVQKKDIYFNRIESVIFGM